MSDICAGVVTFQPDIDRLKLNLDNVVSQVEKVYIVDNNSTNIDNIKKIVLSFDNVSLIENKHNYGIAKALNQIFDEALKQKFNWVLTLDQDTIIPSNMIVTFEPYMKDEQTGIICPSVYYEGWRDNKKKYDTIEYINACMTTASLTRIESWQIVRGFREEYFIDYVDNEFCMKLRINNYKILRVCSTCISHQLGKTGTIKFLGINIRYSFHSPLRLYYMARNNYSFINEYKKYLFVIKEKIKLYYIMISAIIFNNKKRETLRYILRGIHDARKGLMGEYK